MTRSSRVVRPAWIVAGTVASSLAALGGCGGDDEDGAPTAKPAPTRAGRDVAGEAGGLLDAAIQAARSRAGGESARPVHPQDRDGFAHVYEGPEADPARDCVTQEWCFEVTLEAAAAS